MNLQNPSLRFFRTIFSVICLVIGITLVIPSLFVLNPAYADLSWGHDGDDVREVGTPGQQPPSGNPEGPITQTAGSGNYTTSICNGLRPVGQQPPNGYAICRSNVLIIATTPPNHDVRVACPGPENVGASWVSAWWYDEITGSTITGTQINGNFSCITIGYTDVNLVCLNNATVDINKFLPNSQGLSTVHANTSWGDGDHSYTSCYNAGRLQASSYVPILEYGRYSAQFNLYGNVVRWRVWDVDPFTGVRSAPELLADSGPQLRKTSARYLQYTCNGAVQSTANSFGGSWTWTENDCAEGNLGGNTPTFQCVNMQAPTVNGVVRSQTNQILRDGKTNTINWITPNVTGASLVNLTNPSTTLTVSGTPTFANKQLEITRGGTKLTPNANYFNDIATAYELRAHWASDKNNPITLNQSYSWLGTWEKTSYAITGVDFDAEEFVITPITVTTQAEVTCNPGNVTFDVLRATNG